MSDKSKGRRQGCLISLIIVLLIGFLCCDVKIGGKLIYKSPTTQLEEYLREKRLRGE